MAPSRSSGILLHVTSLPGPYGIGDLGPAAYRFADLLAFAGQQLWQVLPLVPTGEGHSPYSSPSTFAGNTLLLSPERLREDGLLSADDLADAPPFPTDSVDFDAALPFKQELLQCAFERFERGEGAVTEAAFEAFCQAERDWLADYALFMALKDAHGGAAWTDWPLPLRLRHPDALAEARRTHARAIRLRQFGQLLFQRQWSALKAYCNARGVRIFGDLPIYVALDSADVWAHPELFQLDERGRPTAVAGVPPDYFSATGQRWGNPLYRWDRMHARDYAWWKRRLEAIFRQVDLVRLDHFRAFEAYWSVPAEAETAVRGEWVEGPGAAFFEALESRFGRPLPIVAEDLGMITDEVHQLMDQFALPGMAVLQFAFHEGPEHPFLPHNYRRRLVAYTGTHDNDTLVGWWRELAESDDECPPTAFARQYLGLNGRHEVHWPFVRALMQSVAERVVVPVQDLLGLGGEARMNVPGSEAGNWTWRLREEQLTREVVDRLRELTMIYGRASDGVEERTFPEYAGADAMGATVPRADC